MIIKLGRFLAKWLTPPLLSLAHVLMDVMTERKIIKVRAEIKAMK